MTVTKSGSIWRGEDHADLAAYLRSFSSGGYPISRVGESVCAQCGGLTFRLFVDDEEGFAARICVTCEAEAYIADSADYQDDAEPGECECPCGGNTFAIAVAFSLLEDGEVRWISVGLRCLTDGRLGVYVDWKIDYGPSEHLLTAI